MYPASIKILGSFFHTGAFLWPGHLLPSPERTLAAPLNRIKVCSPPPPISSLLYALLPSGRVLEFLVGLQTPSSLPSFSVLIRYSGDHKTCPPK